MGDHKKRKKDKKRSRSSSSSSSDSDRGGSFDKRLLEERKKSKKMPLSKFPQLVGRNSEIKETNDDYFPILALPNELLFLIISFLSMKDRLRVRVNKILNDIVVTKKYYVKKLLIEEKSVKGENGDDDKIKQRITFYKEKSYSSDCIRRVAQNHSIGTLVIKPTGSDKFHREIYNRIKEFDVQSIDLASFKHLNYGKNSVVQEEMVDSFFLDLMRSCKILYMPVCEKITPEAIRQVYNDMMEGSTKLRELKTALYEKKCTAFLKLIGVTRSSRYDEPCSTRDIEVYQHRKQHQFAYSIFDRNVEIYLCHSFTSVIVPGTVVIKLHENRESLEKAKNIEWIRRVDND